MKPKKFENILDECLERLLKGGTIEQCLADFPEHRDTLKPLLETALALKEISAIQPSPEFRERARNRFYTALREREVQRSQAFFRWQPRWAVAVAIVLFIVLAGGVTAAAANGSMPDQPLYSVKLATEQVRLALTPSALGKAEFYARLADKRVAEIARMANENKPEKIEQATQHLGNYLADIANLSSVQKEASLTAMAPTAPRVQTTPTTPTTPTAPTSPTTPTTPQAPIVPTVPPAPLPMVGASGGEASASEDGTFTDRSAETAETVTRIAPRSRFEESLEIAASDNLAYLLALLETAPPSSRPALQQAIAVLESGYDRAIKSLAK